MLARNHRELEVYTLAFKSALEIYEISKTFPKEEMYSLADQICRCSRSVCSNIAEAFRKRKYEKHFVSKLSDSEVESGETQVWIEFSLAHAYISRDFFER